MKKKVLLYLSATPNYGGIFNYCIFILQYFYRINNIDLTVFYSSKLYEKYLNNKSTNILIKKKSYIKLKIILYYIYNIIFFKKILKKFFTIFVNTKKNNYDCIFFLYHELILFPSNNSKIISVIHDLMHIKYNSQFREYNKYSFFLRNFLFSNIIKNSNLLISDSLQGKNEILRNYRIKKKIKVIPYIPIINKNQKINYKMLKKNSLDKNFLFYPAKFWDHKNHKNLIGAFALLNQKKYKDIKLVLTGDLESKLYFELKEIISKNLLNDKILILGQISNNQIYSLYKKALALVYVSLIGPTNIPPLEAQILKCPVICSNLHSAKLQLGKSAILINPLKVNDIYESICKIIDNKKLRRSLIKKGSENIKDKLKKNNITKIIEGIIFNEK